MWLKVTILTTILFLITMATIIKKGTSAKKAKQLIDEAVSKAGKKDLKKYAGVLKTDIDPLDYQKQVRDEWE